MYLQINTFILKDKNKKSRDEKAFISIGDYSLLDKSKLDYDYLEGAIIIEYKGVKYLNFEEWDIVVQLWLYFLQAINNLRFQESVKFSLPDQPYIISISIKNTDYLHLSFNGIEICIEKLFFFNEIFRSSKFFFEKLLLLFPEHISSITENLAYIKEVEQCVLNNENSM